MKNIALALTMLIAMAACSSGTTVAELPPVVTGFYEGGYESLNRNDKGTMRLNLVQDETSGEITGTIQITFSPVNETCLGNAVIAGVISGFSVTLTATITNSDGEEGELTLQLTANDNNLSGTYVTSGATCSSFSGSGNVNLSR